MAERRHCQTIINPPRGAGCWTSALPVLALSAYGQVTWNTRRERFKYVAWRSSGSPSRLQLSRDFSSRFSASTRLEILHAYEDAHEGATEVYAITFMNGYFAALRKRNALCQNNQAAALLSRLRINTYKRERTRE